MPTVECCGFAEAEQGPDGVDGDVERPEPKNENAMIRSAIFSRASGSLPANCQATAAAEDTSITESRPNPISAVEDDPRAFGERDDGLDHVVGDRGRRRTAGSGATAPGADRRTAGRAGQAGPVRQPSAAVLGRRRRGSRTGRRPEPGRSGRRARARCADRPVRSGLRRPSGTATTSPQPRRQARWLDTIWRDTPICSASSDGYPGAARRLNRICVRVVSESA